MLLLYSLTLLLAIAPVGALITLRSDMDATRAQKQHALLMVMLLSPHDHGCNVALPMFRKAASSWKPAKHGNVTFAVGDIEATPDLATAAKAEIGSLPTYLLYVHGLAKPVRYLGGWSETSITTWLHQQAALQRLATISRQCDHPPRRDLSPL